MPSRKLKPGWSKFVQITASQASPTAGGWAALFALDDNGRVWVYNARLSVWARLPAKRTNEFGQRIVEGRR